MQEFAWIAMFIKKPLFALVSIIGIFVVVWGFYAGGSFFRADQFIGDVLARSVRADTVMPENVKVILIDDTTINDLDSIVGRWPWPRSLWADLLEYISLGEPKAVVFDILFSERQTGSDDDLFFGDALAFTPGSTLAAMLFNDPTVSAAPLPPEAADRFSLDIPPDSRQALNRLSGDPLTDYYLPIPVLRNSCERLGIVSVAPDADGVYRRFPVLFDYNGAVFPVLGLSAFTPPNTTVNINGNTVTANGVDIPVDDDGNALVNVYGDSFAYSIGALFSSMQSIVDGDFEGILVDPEEFRDSVVFIGASAVGVEDLKPTAISEKTPGVLLHAFFAGNIIDGDFLTPAQQSHALLLTIIACIFITLMILFSRRLMLKAIVTPTVVIGSVVLAYAARSSGQVVDIAPVLAASLSAMLVGFAYLSITEERDKRKVRAVFSQYVSREVLDIITEGGADYLALTKGFKTRITIMFLDIRNFTTISESSDPEMVVGLLNGFFTDCNRVILDHGGTIDKYLGDGLMAFWGAPLPMDDHAQKALEAARQMTEIADRVNHQMSEKGFAFEFRIGIGLNTGDAIVGNIGSEQKLNFTAIGDPVNTAARVEQLTKQYGQSIILTQSTLDETTGIPCVALGEVTVKGKSTALQIYAPKIES